MVGCLPILKLTAYTYLLLHIYACDGNDNLLETKSSQLNNCLALKFKFQTSFLCYYWQLHLKHINNSILVGHTLSQEDLEILMNFSLGYYLATNNLLTHLLQNFPSISYTNIKY